MTTTGDASDHTPYPTPTPPYRTDLTGGQLTKRVDEWSKVSLQVATPKSIKRDQKNGRIGAVLERKGKWVVHM